MRGNAPDAEVTVDRKLQKSRSIPLTLSPLSFPFLSSSLFSFPLSSLSSQIPSGPIGAAGLQPTCRQRGDAVAAAGDSGAAGRVGRGGEARGRRGGAPPREGRRAAFFSFTEHVVQRHVYCCVLVLQVYQGPRGFRGPGRPPPHPKGPG